MRSRFCAALARVTAVGSDEKFAFGAGLLHWESTCGCLRRGYRWTHSRRPADCSPRMPFVCPRRRHHAAIQIHRRRGGNAVPLDEQFGDTLNCARVAAKAAHPARHDARGDVGGSGDMLYCVTILG